jgi:hypothetical protein
MRELKHRVAWSRAHRGKQNEVIQYLEGIFQPLHHAYWMFVLESFHRFSRAGVLIIQFVLFSEH